MTIHQPTRREVLGCVAVGALAAGLPCVGAADKPGGAGRFDVHHHFFAPELAKKLAEKAPTPGQALLRRHGRRDPVRVRSAAMLQGLLRCLPCNCRMSPTWVVGSAGTRYRYYVCSQAQRRGWQRCPSKSLSAAVIEKLVVAQVRALANDPDGLQEMIDSFPAADTADVAPADEGPPREVIRQPAWDELSAEDRAAVLRRLVERVSYDGARGKVAVS